MQAASENCQAALDALDRASETKIRGLYRVAYVDVFREATKYVKSLRKAPAAINFDSR